MLKRLVKIKQRKPSVALCNECGKSVAPGLGKFVNRVVDLNDYETRLEMGKPFPEGDFICADCDTAETLEEHCAACQKPIAKGMEILWRSQFYHLLCVTETLKGNDDADTGKITEPAANASDALRRA